MYEYKQDFLDKLNKAYPNRQSLIEKVKEHNTFAGRWLDDSIETIYYTEVLEANSLEELQEKAYRIKLQHQIYSEYMSGECYSSKEDLRAHNCPRLYGQCSDRDDVLDAFSCYGVSHIPDCPKFKTGECWARFDQLGLQGG